jgi:hypothetical protein
LTAKPKGKRQLGTPRDRWEDYIKLDVRKIGFGMWIGFISQRIGADGGLL